VGSLTCTRSDALAGGASYPPITVSVDVAPDAPAEVLNVATISGGGDAVTDNNSANDATTIAPRNDSGGGGDGAVNADTDPPDTSIREPRLKGKKVTLRFSSDERGSTFECKLDKGKFKPCTSPQKYKKLDEGKHKFFALATDAAGNEEEKAAKAKFEVG